MKQKSKFNSFHGTLIFIFAIAANLAIQLAAGFVIAGAEIGGEKGLIESAFFNYGLMLVIQIAFTGVYFYILRKKNIEDPPVNYKNKIVWWAIPLAAAIGFLAIPAFYPATLWFTLMLERFGYIGADLVELKTVGEFIFGSLVIVVAAPIGEELVSRGALLSSLKMRFGFKKAVVLSALAFMLMHMNPAQTAYQFLLGLVLAVAALVTGSVIIPAVIHAASNLAALLLEYTALGTLADSFIVYFFDKVFLGILVSLLITAVFGAVIAALLWFLYKRHKSVPVKVELSNEPLIGSVRFGDRSNPFDREYNQTAQEYNKTDPFYLEPADSPFDDAIAQKQLAQEQLEQSITDKKSKIFYIGAIAVCTFMWIVNLFASMFIEQ